MKKISFSFDSKYLVLFFLSSTIFLNLIIPPFQNPDETQHFGLVLSLGQYEDSKNRNEKGILEIMYKNEWWRYLGIGRPVVLPDSFYKFDFLNYYDFKSNKQQTILYHFVLGKAANLFFKENINHSYYFCRFISAIMNLASLVLCYLIFFKLHKVGSKYQKGDNPRAAQSNDMFWGLFYILFLPQLMINSLSVNPDSFAIFLGSVFCYSAFCLITGPFRIHFFILSLCAVVFGLFSDPSVFFLVPMLLFLPFLVLGRKKIHYSFFVFFFSLLSLILIASWVSWYFPTHIYMSLRSIKIQFFNYVSEIPRLFSFTEFSREFIFLFSDSFLFRFGWMAFGADKIFYYVWRVIVLLTFFGVIIYLGKYFYLKMKKQRFKSIQSSTAKLVLFSLISISIQVASLWILQGTKNILAQGRYLFPLVIPIAFVFILGLKNLFSLFHKRGGQIAIALFILFEFFFFNYVVWNYLIPVFHLTVKSPHPGL